MTDRFANDEFPPLTALCYYKEGPELARFLKGHKFADHRDAHNVAMEAAQDCCIPRDEAGYKSWMVKGGVSYATAAMEFRPQFSPDDATERLEERVIGDEMCAEHRAEYAGVLVCNSVLPYRLISPRPCKDTSSGPVPVSRNAEAAYRPYSKIGVPIDFDRAHNDLCKREGDGVCPSKMTAEQVADSIRNSIKLPAAMVVQRSSSGRKWHAIVFFHREDGGEFTWRARRFLARLLAKNIPQADPGIGEALTRAYDPALRTWNWFGGESLGADVLLSKMPKRRITPNSSFENFDWRGLLEYVGVEYVEGGKNTSSGNLAIACPLCGDDPSTHFGIDPERGLFNCWRDRTHKGGPQRLVQLLSEGHNVGELMARFGADAKR